MEIMEKILKGIFVGGLSLSAFLMGKAYGIRETNEEYKKIIKPYFNKIIELYFNKIIELYKSEIENIREEVTEKLKDISEEN